MNLKAPEFLFSEYMYTNAQGNSALRLGTPTAVQKEFERYKRQLDESKDGFTPSAPLPDTPPTGYK